MVMPGEPGMTTSGGKVGCLFYKLLQQFKQHQQSLPSRCFSLLLFWTASAYPECTCRFPVRLRRAHSLLFPGAGGAAALFCPPASKSLFSYLADVFICRKRSMPKKTDCLQDLFTCPAPVAALNPQDPNM